MLLEVAGDAKASQEQRRQRDFRAGRLVPAENKKPRGPLPGAGFNTILVLHEKLNWCRLQDSNPPPSDYKSTALPDELSRRSQRFYFI